MYGVSNGRLFASANAGQSWTAVPFPIVDPLVRVAVDPPDSRLLLAATSATGLWRSVDRGLTWAAASTADSSPLDVAFAPNGSALASFNVTSDAVLARWGRLRTAGSARYTYYQASVTYLGGHLAEVGRAVAADANTVGSYIAGQSPTGAFVARFAPSPAACTSQVTPRERIVFPTQEGGAGVVRVLAPSGCPWTVSASDSWLVTNAAVNRTGTGEVRFFALTNPNAANRSDTLSISATVVSVEQAGATCSTGVSLSNSGTSLFSLGTILYPTLNIAPACAWTADTAAPWITLPSASGFGPGAVSVVVAQNLTPFARSSPVRIRPVSFTVYQASRCFVTLSPAVLALPGTSFSGQFEVLTGEDCSWSVAAADPGITFTSAVAGFGPSLVSYTISANPASTSRTLTITGGTVALTIVQNGGSSCTFSIDNAPRSFSPLAATGTVAVATQANCVRPAFSDQPWLTLNGTTQTGSGNLGFSLAANSTSARRTANLTLDGRFIPFTQEGLSTQVPGVFAPVPASGSGIEQTFSFQFAAGNGATNLEVLNLLINN